MVNGAESRRAKLSLRQTGWLRRFLGRSLNWYCCDPTASPHDEKSAGSASDARRDLGESRSLRFRSREGQDPARTFRLALRRRHSRRRPGRE